MELLAAITVIAILAVLTIGAVKNAMAGAQRIGCAANLMKVGQALLLYANDNDGMLPGTSSSMVGPQYVNGVPVQGAYPLVAKALAPYIPDSVWVDPDPHIKRMVVSSKGVWFKVGIPYYTTLPNPLSAPPAQSLLAYPKPATVPILRCNGGSVVPSDGMFWAHNGWINWLFLDGHVQSANASSLSPF